MRFPTARVMTVYSGYCMGAGIGIAQDVFDHLYPGIMTLGCAAMQPKAAEELARQFPRVLELQPITDDGSDYIRFLIDATVIFGKEMDVAGPAKTSEDEIAAAFGQFGRGLTQGER